MRGLAGFVGMNVGGAIGWWLGSCSGLTLSVVLSAVGSGAGLYAARKLAEAYLE